MSGGSCETMKLMNLKTNLADGVINYFKGSILINAVWMLPLVGLALAAFAMAVFLMPAKAAEWVILRLGLPVEIIEPIMLIVFFFSIYVVHKVIQYFRLRRWQNTDEKD